MSKETWFSSKLRFVIMVAPVGGDILNDRVILFKAKDFDHAFQRALAIGEMSENEYLNDEANLVSWKFMEVISVDVIRSNLDGAEIYSEPIHLSEEKMIPYGTEFNPRASEPIQTI